MLFVNIAQNELEVVMRNRNTFSRINPSSVVTAFITEDGDGYVI